MHSNPLRPEPRPLVDPAADPAADPPAALPVEAAAGSAAGAPPEGPSMVDYVYGVVRRGRRIAAVALAAGVVTAVVALLLPSWYAAHTSFLPAPEERTTTSMTAVLRGLMVPGGGLPEMVQAGDLSVGLMRSRRIRQALVEAFGLVEAYGARDLDGALRALDAHTSFHVGQEGMVTVTVEDREPARAAALANRTVELLDQFNASQRMTRGRRTRVFLEQQLVQTRGELEAAEDSLQAFQSRTKSVPLSPDVQAAIDAGSNLLTRKMQLEIALQVKGRWLAEHSEELARLRSEFDEVESRLGELPVLNLEFARLVRDVKVHEQVYSFLRAEYEQSKIREQEDTPTLTLVDRAVPLELRARPRRKLMVMTAVLVAGLLAMLGALGTTYVELLPPAGRRRRLLGATGAELRRLLLPGRRAT